MSIFRNINMNLYKMYFKKLFDLKNQYDYIKYMYLWNQKAVEEFEKGTFNKSNVAYKWMQNGIPHMFFMSPNTKENILDSKNLFDICYYNLRNILHLTSNKCLSDIIYKIIYSAENTAEPFEWEKGKQSQMIHIFEKYNTTQVLSTLLIYAETGLIYTPNGKYELKNNFKYVKSYAKEIINKHFDEFIEDAIDINMSQISLPSLMDSYKEFYKKNIKNSIFNSLEKDHNFRLRILLMDSNTTNVDAFLNSYMFGDTFSESKKVINDSISFASTLTKQFPNQVTVKTTSAPTSYSFMQIKKSTTSIIKIDVYTPFNNSDDRFSLIFDEFENKELYDYYSRTFWRMFWNGSIIKIE